MRTEVKSVPNLVDEEFTLETGVLIFAPLRVLSQILFFFNLLFVK